MKRRIQNVAIIGAGPAASSLATLLARAGKTVVIFHQPKRAPLIVGESLVPAIVLMLRELGVEDEVRSFGKYKPGACFNFTEGENFPFLFANFCGSFPPYAYNVPRDKFDATLLEAARWAGVKTIEFAAGIERVAGTDRVQLNRETVEAAGGITPDLIVDATGRARMLPKLLDIGAQEGGRKDTALFAHVDQTVLYQDGYVHSSQLDHGWSWRIPLPGRVSVGCVINSEFLPKFGTTKEERYDNLLKQDSYLRTVAGDSKRLTPVMEHTNYQLVSNRLFGDGWVLVGDTAGFIDPVFSSGLFIGMSSAFALAKAIGAGTTEAFQQYEREVTHHLKTWHEVVSYYYDGRLFTCCHVGQMLKDKLLMKLTMPHIDKHMGRIFLGAASTSPYSIRLLRFAMKYGLDGQDPQPKAIR